MKVYVDELPKSCKECPCLDYESDCQLLSSEDMDWKGINRKHTKCPLQSLSEYNNQIINDFVYSAKSALIDKIKHMKNEEHCYLQKVVKWEDILNILNKLGENK